MIAAKDYTAAETLFGTMSRTHKDDPRAQALADIGMGAVALGKGELDLARVRLTAAATLHFKADEERPRARQILAPRADHGGGIALLHRSGRSARGGGLGE